MKREALLGWPQSEPSSITSPAGPSQTQMIPAVPSGFKWGSSYPIHAHQSTSYLKGYLWPSSTPTVTSTPHRCCFKSSTGPDGPAHWSSNSPSLPGLWPWLGSLLSGPTNLISLPWVLAPFQALAPWLKPSWLEPPCCGLRFLLSEPLALPWLL